MANSAVAAARALLLVLALLATLASGIRVSDVDQVGATTPVDVEQELEDDVAGDADAVESTDYGGIASDDDTEAEFADGGSEEEVDSELAEGEAAKDEYDYNLQAESDLSKPEVAKSPSPSPPPLKSSVPGSLEEFLQASDEEVKKVAIEGITPLSVTGFKCSNDNRAPCKAGESIDAKCRRDVTCELSEWREKHKGPWMPCCKKFALFELMVWFHNALGKVDNDGNGFWWALNGGTLLGSLRDDDVVDWTTDLDIIVPKEYEPLVMQRLKDAMKIADPKYGFQITSSDDQEDTRRMNFDNAGALIDVFFAHGYRDGDEENATEVFKNNDTRGGMGTGHVLPMLNVPNRSEQESGRAPPCVKYWGDTFPGKWLFPLKKCPIQGQEFPCIKDSEEMLKFNYGEEWKKPDGMKPPEARWQCGDPT